MRIDLSDELLEPMERGIKEHATLVLTDAEFKEGQRIFFYHDERLRFVRMCKKIEPVLLSIKPELSISLKSSEEWRKLLFPDDMQFAWEEGYLSLETFFYALNSFFDSDKLSVVYWEPLEPLTSARTTIAPEHYNGAERESRANILNRSYR